MCFRVAQIQQKVMTSAVVASMLVNMGTVLSVSAMSVAASGSFIAAGCAGVGVLVNWIKVCRADTLGLRSFTLANGWELSMC